FDFSITQLDHGLRQRRRLEAVGRYDSCGVLLARETPEQFKNDVAGDRVQIAGRLVSEDDTRSMDERPRNGDTLHLARRELARLTLAEAVELDPREALPGHLARPRFSREQQRQ